MDYIIQKSLLHGMIPIPTSKSFSHRHLIMAMLSKKQTLIKNVNLCDDIYATLNVARNLGVKVEIVNNDIMMDSSSLWQTNDEIMDVYASGSTLRFLIPVCLTHRGQYQFYMRDRLKERSLKIYEDLFKNCTFERKDNVLMVSGQIEAGYYEIDGSHSSQFISGLLMALPLLNGDSEIKIKRPFVSQDYFYMTLDCVKKAGIDIQELHDLHYRIKGNQTYNYASYAIESDASAATFIKVAKYLGQDVECQMTRTTYQKDAIIDTFLEKIKVGSCKIDVTDCPDIVPALALAMALSPYCYEIVGASRLVDKESNRLEAVCSDLNTLGGMIEVTSDGLRITGVKQLYGGAVDSFNDHRIAMMATIAAMQCKDPVVLKNGECVKKSWPTFYKDIKTIGGVISEL